MLCHRHRSEFFGRSQDLLPEKVRPEAQGSSKGHRQREGLEVGRDFVIDPAHGRYGCDCPKQFAASVSLNQPISCERDILRRGLARRFPD
jgi:hypothetical protein